MKLINYLIAALVLGFLAQGAYATHGGVHAMKDSRGTSYSVDGKHMGRDARGLDAAGRAVAEMSSKGPSVAASHSGSHAVRTDVGTRHVDEADVVANRPETAAAGCSGYSPGNPCGN